MDGAKAGALLAGRPLLAWAVAALRDSGAGEVVVVAKRGTALPETDAPLWREPDEPRHPLAGVRHALAEAAGDDVLTLPVDLPLVPPRALRRLATADAGDAPCAVARADDRVQPLVARFRPPAFAALRAEGRATDAVLALGPLVVDLPAEGFLNVNTPDDLAAAEEWLRRRGA